MQSIRQILMTMAVISFTALSIWNFQRGAPVDEVAYAKYMYSYIFYLCASIGLMFILLLSRYRNRIIISCMLFNGLLFLAVGLKSYFHEVDANNDYDYTIIGLIAMPCISYLIAPYSIKALSLFKMLINQAYMRCQTRKKLD